MSISVLDIIGIHQKDIDHAYKECEDALTTAYLKAMVDYLPELTSERLAGEDFHFSPATNSLIDAMFEVTSNIITEEYPALTPEWYVNGYDSHFYLRDDDLFETLTKAGIEPDTIRAVVKCDLANELPLNDISETIRLASDADRVKDFIEVIESGNAAILYENKADFAEDNLVDDEDIPESQLADFLLSVADHLLESYEKGESDEVYFVQQDGSVIAGKYR